VSQKELANAVLGGELDDAGSSSGVDGSKAASASSEGAQGEDPYSGRNIAVMVAIAVMGSLMAWAAVVTMKRRTQGGVAVSDSLQVEMQPHHIRHNHLTGLSDDSTML